MIAIAAADENWGIGYRNRLLCTIPEDMALFRRTTTGHTVVMGRRTLESFPGGRPLAGRKNIVLTGDPFFAVEGAAAVHSVEELLIRIDGCDPDEVFVIGGASVYRQLLPFCDRCLITRVYRVFPADAFFPDLDRDPSWRIEKRSGLKDYGGLNYEFFEYVKCSVSSETFADTE